MAAMNLSKVQGGGDTDIEMSVAGPTANGGTASPQSRNTCSLVDPSFHTPRFQVQSPITVAENHIISHTSSLHEGLATLLLDKGKKFSPSNTSCFSKRETFPEWKMMRLKSPSLPALSSSYKIGRKQKRRPSSPR
jgi:hypothetical protein